MPTPPTLVISVVSHGHGQQVQRLLGQIADSAPAQLRRVVLTLNIPEPALALELALQPPSTNGWPFALEIRHNPHPQGFGANHNQALADAPEDWLCILNPDVSLLPEQPPWEALMAAATSAATSAAIPTANVGCTYPLQVDAQGRLQDSQRQAPTPLALWRRRVLRQPEQRTDWVNGACMVIPRTAWQQVGGFDTRYFMYCEDVDLCLRLRLAGWQLAAAPSAKVLHQGTRASHRQWQHLRWHITSLLRLWCSPVLWRALRLK